jgi:hypothetical protein
MKIQDPSSRPAKFLALSSDMVPSESADDGLSSLAKRLASTVVVTAEMPKYAVEKMYPGIGGSISYRRRTWNES